MPSLTITPYNALWFSKGEAPDIAGYNTYLPESLRTEPNLDLLILWLRDGGAESNPADAIVTMTIVGYDKLINRIVPLAVVTLVISFLGSVSGIEDVYTTTDLAAILAGYAGGSANIESLGFIFSRQIVQEDTMAEDVGFRNLRTV